MSVLMTLRATGDAKGIEAGDQALLKSISDRAHDQGAIHHRFYGSDTEVLVIDEWADEAAFQAFFDGTPEIKGIMDGAGVTSAPTVEFWRVLDTEDGF